MEQAQPSLDPVQQESERLRSGTLSGRELPRRAGVAVRAWSRERAARGQNPCAGIHTHRDELNAHTPPGKAPWLGSTGA